MRYEGSGLPHNCRTECSLCHEPAVAQWHDKGTIGLCATCAVEHIPRLLADAVDVTDTDIAQWCAALNRIQAQFLRAAQSRIETHQRRHVLRSQQDQMKST